MTDGAASPPPVRRPSPQQPSGNPRLTPEQVEGPTTFASLVGAKATRKRRARSNSGGVWFGLGMMGLIGWSVVVPTLAGAALGLWLDKHHPGNHAWTLALLMGGLTIGCLNAWHWVAKEDKAMRQEQSDDDA